MVDFSIEDQPEFSASEPPQRPRRRVSRWLTIGAPIAAVVLVGGGVAAAELAGKLAGTSTPGLAAAFPAKTIAFTQVNLDPSANQKIAIYDIAHKFPEVKDKVSKDDPAHSLIDYLVKQSGGNDVVTWNKIKAWAGVRVGAGLLTTSDDTPYPLVIVQVKDEQKAKDGLAELAKQNNADSSNDPLVYKVQNGYAYLSTSQSNIDDALKDLAANGVLAKTSAYDAVSGTVGNGDVAGGFANLAALKPLAKKYEKKLTDGFASESGSSSGSFSMGSGSSTSAASFQSQPMSSSDGGSNPLGGLGGLIDPGTVTKQFDKGIDQLKGSVTFNVELNGGGGRLNVDMYGQDSKTTPAGAVTGIANLPADSALALDVHGLGPTYQKEWSSVAPALTKLLGQFTDGTDIKLPDDLSAVLGNDTAFALAGDENSPEFGAVIDGGNGDRAKQILQELVGKYANGAHLPVEVYGSGSNFAVASSASYAAQLTKGANTLGTTPLFRSAVPDAANAQFALYVNVQKLLAFGRGGASGDAAMIAGVGMTGAMQSDHAHLEVNLVLK